METSKYRRVYRLCDSAGTGSNLQMVKGARSVLHKRPPRKTKSPSKTGASDEARHTIDSATLQLLDVRERRYFQRICTMGCLTDPVTTE